MLVTINLTGIEERMIRDAAGALHISERDVVERLVKYQVKCAITEKQKGLSDDEERI